MSGTSQEGGAATSRTKQGGGTSDRRLEVKTVRDTREGAIIGVHGEDGTLLTAVAVYKPLRLAVAVDEDPLWQKLHPVAERYCRDTTMSYEDFLKAVEEAVNTT
jgi:hypothetical protein